MNKKELEEKQKEFESWLDDYLYGKIGNEKTEKRGYCLKRYSNKHYLPS